ncbi:MAG: hypothetical protein Fur0025_30600 [Oscillatoriaceae cyanobacterium]
MLKLKPQNYLIVYHFRKKAVLIHTKLLGIVHKAPGIDGKFADENDPATEIDILIIIEMASDRCK